MGIHLAVLFYQMGKKYTQFLYLVGKKERLGRCRD